MLPSGLTVQAFSLTVPEMDDPSPKVLAAAEEEVPKAANFQSLSAVVPAAKAAAGRLARSIAPASTEASMRRTGCVCFAFRLMMFLLFFGSSGAGAFTLANCTLLDTSLA